MDNRDETTDNSESKMARGLDEIAVETLHDAIRENSRRPGVREVIANHPDARDRIYREAEVMEFDPEEVYSALERIQEAYDAFEAAERRPIVDNSDNYVAFGLNGNDWWALFEFARQGIDDEEMREYIAHVVTKVMSDITGGSWHSHNSLPLVLAENEVRDVLAYHKEAYDGPRFRRRSG